MTHIEINRIISQASKNSIRETLNNDSLDGVVVTATFKKTPALEVRSAYTFKKDAEVSVDNAAEEGLN